MGGKGSGRKKKEETIIKDLSNSNNATTGDVAGNMILPNYSGLKDEVRKTNKEEIATVSYVDSNIITDHDNLNNLDYASAGHTGFASSTDLSNHTSLTDEHIDWTASQTENIHTDNYTDTDTTYTAGTNLTLSGTEFNVDDSFLINDGNDTTTGKLTANGFDANSNKIENVADPTANQEAATKKYVDDNAGGGGSDTLGVVVHGSDNTASRPTGYSQVKWIGSVEPDNAENNDIWVDAGQKNKTLDVDLIAYWKLDDDAANTTVTDSHSTHDGTASSNTSTLSSTGKINTAFDFVSSNPDYVSIPDHSDFDATTSKISISAWVKPDTKGAEPFLGKFGGSNEWIAEITNGEPAFWMNGSWHIASSSIPTDTWSHITFTFSGADDEVKIYINGELDNTISETGTITEGTDDISIGTRKAAVPGQFPYDGEVDEIALYKKTLSSSEVSDLYNNGDGRSYSNLTEAYDYFETIYIKLSGVFVKIGT